MCVKLPRRGRFVLVSGVAALLSLGSGCATDRQAKTLEEAGPSRDQLAHVVACGVKGGAMLSMLKLEGTTSDHYAVFREPGAREVFIEPDDYSILVKYDIPSQQSSYSGNTGKGGDALIGALIVALANAAAQQAQKETEDKYTGWLHASLKPGCTYAIKGRRYGATFVYWAEDTATRELVGGDRFDDKMIDTLDEEGAARFLEGRKDDFIAHSVALTTNQFVVRYALYNVEAERVRRNAYQRLDDQSLLEHGLLNETRPTVRYVAARRVQNPEVLAKAARFDSDAGVRCVAINRIDDIEVLSSIAGSEPDPSIAKRARKRLKRLAKDKSRPEELRLEAKAAIKRLKE